MALPSSTMFNYNARDYDAVTHTLPKNANQILDFDIVFNGTPTAVGADYLDLSGGDCNSLFDNCVITYNDTQSNPFNRDNTSRTLTIIYKTSGFTGDAGWTENLLANRNGGDYNWMVRSTVFHTSDGSFLYLTPVTDPQIFVIRVSSDGTAVRKQIDASGNTIQSVSGSVWYGSTCNQFNFFKGGVPEGECEDFGSTFYWMYCSLDALTDEQILDVVNYNNAAAPTPIINKTIPYNNIYRGETNIN